MPSTIYHTPAEFSAAVRSLINGWQVRGALQLVGAILPSFVTCNGKREGWAKLSAALESVIVHQVSSLTPEELRVASELHRAVFDLSKAANDTAAVTTSPRPRP